MNTPLSRSGSVRNSANTIRGDTRAFEYYSKLTPKQFYGNYDILMLTIPLCRGTFFNIDVIETSSTQAVCGEPCVYELLLKRTYWSLGNFLRPF